MFNPIGIKNRLESWVSTCSDFEFCDNSIWNDCSAVADDGFQRTEPARFGKVAEWSGVEHKRGWFHACRKAAFGRWRLGDEGPDGVFGQ